MSGRRAALSSANARATSGPALHHDPLADEQILESFYRPRPEAASRRSSAAPDHKPDHKADQKLEQKAKPTHYKIVCISLYNDDIERLGRLVDALKARGHTKANKSQLIRAALDQVDLDKVPKSH